MRTGHKKRTEKMPEGNKWVSSCGMCCVLVSLSPTTILISCPLHLDIMLLNITFTKFSSEKKAYKKWIYSGIGFLWPNKSFPWRRRGGGDPIIMWIFVDAVMLLLPWKKMGRSHASRWYDQERKFILSVR